MSSLGIEGLSGRAVVTGSGLESIVERSEQMTGRQIERRLPMEGGAQGPLGDAAQAANTFSEVLRQSVEKVNEYQTQADTAIQELAAGRSKNLHETLLAVERADTSLKLMMQVRNKVLDAYREIMRMQV